MKHLLRTAALIGLGGLAACSTPGSRSLNPSCLDMASQPKYQRDGHQDTTYIVAVLAGRSARDAARLSFFNQAADDVALPFAAPQVSVWGSFGAWGYRHRINAVLHSLHGGDLGAVAQRRTDLAGMIADRTRAGGEGDWQTGFLIHSLGDSFAHTNAVGEAYGHLYGHVFDGHWPDLVGNRRALYFDYVDALFASLEVDGASDRDGMAAFKASLRAAPDGDVSAVRRVILAMRDEVAPAPRLECEALAGQLTMRNVSRFLREVEAGFGRDVASS